MAKVKNMFKFFKTTELSDWNRTDEKLLKAVEANDMNKVVAILNKKPISTTKLGPKGYSVLHYVCVKGYEDMVELFIAHGANVNLTNERGNSPLHLSSHNGFSKIVCRLLMAGAKIDFLNPYQMTALHVACNNKNENVVHILIENKAEVEARDKTQKTPLFFSCYHGHLGICQYLLENGANINAEDITKVTPLLTAVRQNNAAIAKFLLGKGADPYVMDSFDESAVKVGQASSTREIKKLFSKMPLTSPSPSPKSESTSEGSLQRETSLDLSVQVMQNLSFGDDLKSEMVEVQLRNPSIKKDKGINDGRPLSAPPDPPKFVVNSIEETPEEWELVGVVPSSPENIINEELTDNLDSVSENIKDEESVDSLNLFPNDNGDSNEASFLGLSAEEHRSCLSISSLSDISTKWDEQKEEEDVISNTSQPDDSKLINYDHEFSFISGNATPKMGSNISLRRQILNLRQENNQLRETIHENHYKMKDQEDEIKNLENLLSEEKTKIMFISQEGSEENLDEIDNQEEEVLSEDDSGTEDQIIKNAEENEPSLKERLSKLMEDNKQFMESLEPPNQVLEQEAHDKKVSNLLQENLNLMQNLEQMTKEMNKVCSSIETEPKENLEDVIYQQDDGQVNEELEDLRERHVDLQSDYDELAESRDRLQEEFDDLQESRDNLNITLQRLKQANEQATKQNCNLLNMKDALKQEVEEMVEQQKNLQEKYDLLWEKTEFLEKTVEKLSVSEDDVQKLSLSHFDETEDLLQAVEAKDKDGSWADDKHVGELKVLQLDNSLLEEQCRKLLLEKDILEEANDDLKEAHDGTVELLNSEKEDLQKEKEKLAKKLKEVTQETDILQQKYSILQQEMHLLKCQVESNSETQLGTNSKIEMLENDNNRLQQQLVQTEKKHEEVIKNYRLHLISAIQGYIDPDVEKALYSIIELRRLEFHC